MGCGASVGRFEEFSSFHAQYSLGSIPKALGKGSYGSVFLATARHAKQSSFAVKVQTARRTATKKIEHEAKIWKLCASHRNVVHFVQMCQEADIYFMVMEACQCSLFDRLIDNPKWVWDQLSGDLHQLMSGLQHLHSRRVLHSDIKAENALYGGPDGKTLKLADFGLAVYITPSEGPLTRARGSRSYMAPEMLAGEGYAFPADMWSFGVLVYVILVGQFPIGQSRQTKSELTRNIIKVEKELFSDGPTESTEADERSGRKRVARLLRHFALLSLLAAVCVIGRQRPSWYEAVRYQQGSQLWAPPEWHKDSEGNDVKDTWDHYQMPNCDSGPPPNARKKVIVGPEKALRKMQEKLGLPTLKIEAVRKMKDVLDLADPQPQLFATDTVRRVRRLRQEGEAGEGEGDEADPLPPTLAEFRDLKDDKVHIKYVPVKRTRAQQICAEHIAIASADHAQMIKAHATFESHRKAIRGLHYWQGTHRCGVQFYNTDFPATTTWKDPRGHESPAHCQQACTWNHDCEGFSWSKWGCFLKKTPKLPENQRRNGSHFIHEFAAGVYSGHPCNQKESPYPWINDEFQKHKLPKPKAYHQAKNASMFCTMLILPYSYEVDLTIMQHQNYYSIFMCEHWQIYSSQPLQLAPRLTTRMVNTSQVAEAAGQWGTALNTEAFVAYWRALILDGDYLKARWLVKVDPDTVWFPHRLVPLLMETEQQHSLEAPGIYLNNCPQGLHGPIEILSQTAFSTLAEVSPKCFWSMNNWGNWQWGEDMWLDQCFLTVGHAKRIYVPKMLAEDHCNNWPGWRSCEAEDIVAFHPFKNAEQYIQCTGKGVTTSTTRTVTQTTTATATTQTTTMTLNENPMEKIENFFGNIFHH